MNELSSLNIRRIILEQSKRANVGHIGSCLSVVEIIKALYSKILNISYHQYSDRDRFILSKGHAVLALYAVFYLKGWISKTELETFHGDPTLLGEHPDHKMKGIDFSTGSLGHGLPMATGAALAAHIQKSERRVFVLVSDAECNEGSLWEAVMFAAHHRLSNITVIIDQNGQQALGYTNEVLSLNPLLNKWNSFGWDVHEVDGHDVEIITKTILNFDKSDDRPHVLIANTTFGKGVSFMEGKIEWHYLPMNDNEYKHALDSIGVTK